MLRTSPCSSARMSMPGALLTLAAVLNEAFLGGNGNGDTVTRICERADTLLHDRYRQQTA